MPERRKSRVVTAGNVKIGGNNRIPVQSMLNIPAEDAEGNVKQALELQKAGCEIIRLTVPNKEAVKTLAAVKEKVSIPVVAIGGINADNVLRLKGRKMAGAAVVSGIFACEDIEKGTRELLEKVESII